MRNTFVLLVAGLVLLGWSGLSLAEEPGTEPPKTTEKDKKGERLWLKGPTIAELKAMGFTDELIAKAKEAVAPITKKIDAVADDAPDAKKTKAGLTEERKKAVYDLAPDDKKDGVADLLDYKLKGGKKHKAGTNTDAGAKPDAPVVDP